MTAPSQIIHFLERCYQADNRERSLLDLFAKKVEFRHFLTHPEPLVTGLASSLPLVGDREALLETARTVRFQRTEREFLFTAFMLVGRFPRSEDPDSGETITSQPFCGPLFVMPGEVEEDDGQPVLQVGFERQQINFPLLVRLAQPYDRTVSEIERLAADLPRGPWTTSHVAVIADRLRQTFPGIQIDGLALYPHPEPEQTLREMRRSKAKRGADLRAVFASCLLMQKRSVSSRGVLSELHQLAEESHLSAPLRRLLAVEADAPTPRRPPKVWTVPAVLSEAQTRVLQNARQEALSLVIGPPGTGKSFTIAALAIDALDAGESVLVASKMDHAVDVVADKIEDLLGVKDFVIRGGRQHYRKQLCTLLEQLLRGILPLTPLPEDERERVTQECRRLESQLADRAKHLKVRGVDENRWGDWAVKSAEGPLWKRLRAGVMRRFYGGSLALKSPYWDEMAEYRTALDRFIDQQALRLRDCIARRIHFLQQYHRQSIQRLLRAFKARQAQRRQERFETIDVEQLFHALPIWMVRLADVDTVVPMHHEIFDLAIIDEATQCDIASCLPIFQRAKRVVIVGDPHQLRHLSFLSRQRQQHLAERLGIPRDIAQEYNYRDRSILDLMEETISRQEQVTLLDEHFRSAPAIIAFSNREFYGGRLKIMQDRPNESSACLAETRVAGTRQESGVNEAEAEALLTEVLRRIGIAQAWPQALCPSIGVLSPFRAQVDYLTEALGQRLDSATIERHDILIGTPFGFQGEERDIVLISLTIDDESHPSTVRFLARPDVLNVAITRARNEQLVFTSLGDNPPVNDPLLRRFLEHLRHPERLTEPPRTDVSDPFLEDVVEALGERNLKLFPAYPIAGLLVDLVVERDERTLGIDLVGYPGVFSHAFEIERYRLFNRAGLRLMPLPYSAWIRNRQNCLDAISEGLNSGTAERPKAPA